MAFLWRPKRTKVGVERNSRGQERFVRYNSRRRPSPSISPSPPPPDRQDDERHYQIPESLLAELQCLRSDNQRLNHECGRLNRVIDNLESERAQHHHQNENRDMAKNQEIRRLEDLLTAKDNKIWNQKNKLRSAETKRKQSSEEFEKLRRQHRRDQNDFENTERELNEIIRRNENAAAAREIDIRDLSLRIQYLEGQLRRYGIPV